MRTTRWLLLSIVFMAACEPPTPATVVRAAEAPPPAWHERPIRADAIGAESALLDPMLDEVFATTGAPRGDAPAVRAHVSLRHDLVVISEDTFRRDAQLELIISDEEGAPMAREVWNLQAEGNHPQAALGSLHEIVRSELRAYFAAAYDNTDAAR